MKKRTLSLALAVAGIAFLLPEGAKAQIGVVVRSVEAGQIDLMSVPLHVIPTNRLGHVAGTLPMDSAVYFYDSTNDWFWGGQKGAKGWTPSVSNFVVLPGIGFFLVAPSNSGFQIEMAGYAPTGPVTNQVHERASALGYPHPWPIAWTETSLSSNLPTGSLVSFWDAEAGDVVTYHKGPPVRGGWGRASNHVIRPGDGFIVRQPPGSAPFLWVE